MLTRKANINREYSLQLLSCFGHQCSRFDQYKMGLSVMIGRYSFIDMLAVMLDLIRALCLGQYKLNVHDVACKAL
jgi:hypothetical protein